MDEIAWGFVWLMIGILISVVYYSIVQLAGILMIVGSLLIFIGGYFSMTLDKAPVQLDKSYRWMQRKVTGDEKTGEIEVYVNIESERKELTQHIWWNDQEVIIDRKMRNLIDDLEKDGWNMEPPEETEHKIVPITIAAGKKPGTGSVSIYTFSCMKRGIKVLVKATSTDEYATPEVLVECRVKVSAAEAEAYLRSYQESMDRFTKQMTGSARAWSENLQAFIEGIERMERLQRRTDEEIVAELFVNPVAARRNIETTVEILPESQERMTLQEMLELPDREICQAFEAWALSLTPETLNMIIQAYKKRIEESGTKYEW